MLKKQDVLVYDCETTKLSNEVRGGWNNVEGMGLASAVVYSYNQDRYYTFLHPRSREKLIKLLHDNICVSFNGVCFDSKLILGNGRLINQDINHLWVSRNQARWIEFDLFLKIQKVMNRCRNDLESIGKRIAKGASLDNTCKLTIGMKKNEKGANAPLLYRQKRYDELLQYNLNDVRMTRQLLEFQQKNNFVTTARKQRVNFNEPKII